MYNPEIQYNLGYKVFSLYEQVECIKIKIATLKKRLEEIETDIKNIPGFDTSVNTKIRRFRKSN
jgi:uncharacterized protein (UPF0335 family)